MKNIIGDGGIASVLPIQNKFLFFASGVADSSDNLPESEYLREIDLLMEQDVTKHIVYFSTLSVFHKDTRYTRHKRLMEKLIKGRFDHYAIMRLGNAIWGNNPVHLINFFRNKIKKGENFPIHDVYRYLVSKEEFLYWIDKIPEWSCEMSVIGKRMKVKDIVEEIKQGLI